MIQLIEEGESIPFDVAATRVIQIDISNLATAEQAKMDIEEHIRSIEEGKDEIDTPVSVAIDLKGLKESENPDVKAIVDIIGEISDIKAKILTIDEKISNPELLLPPSYFEYILKDSGRMFGLQRDRRINIAIQRQIEMLQDNLMYRTKQLQETEGDEKDAIIQDIQNITKEIITLMKKY